MLLVITTKVLQVITLLVEAGNHHNHHPNSDPSGVGVGVGVIVKHEVGCVQIQIAWPNVLRSVSVRAQGWNKKRV